ncbi:4-galactosyl-N-acetylglucosaminide 3-alpha-L-fucosyltransferase FUT6-like [Discoglossus pictus]
MESLVQTNCLKKGIFFFILQTVFSFVLFASFRGSRNLVREIDHYYIQKSDSVQNTNQSQKSNFVKNIDQSLTIPSQLNESLLIILLWTWPFGDHFQLNQCPQCFDGNGCFFTANRSLYSGANAVVFHHRDVYHSKNQLPQMPRPSNQYWIWFNLESPTHSPNLGIMNNIINLTASYRADSDIFCPYGWLDKNTDVHNFTIPEKTKFVAWVVSNWNPNNLRVKYYEELRKYIPIDVYGRNRMQLPRANHTSVISTYKFYLAFENSLHQDYITEKLWKNSLTSGTVPVVLGPPRENYERFIPPDSFIHVNDFKTPKELADYLLKLDKDNAKYQEYFKWRSIFHPTPSISWVTHYCKMCKALKEAPSYRTIPSIAKWFK